MKHPNKHHKIKLRSALGTMRDYSITFTSNRLEVKEIGKSENSRYSVSYETFIGYMLIFAPIRPFSVQGVRKVDVCLRNSDRDLQEKNFLLAWDDDGIYSSRLPLKTPERARFLPWRSVICMKVLGK